MDKKEALRIIIDCANTYHKNLEGKQYLFVFKKGNEKFSSFESTFLAGNFLHLTGITIKKGGRKAAKEFYRDCLNGRVSIESFDMKKDGTTVLKLSVLPALMNLHKCAKMIGDFDGVRVKLRTDRLIGNVRGCMGFVAQNNIFVPNTVLCHDMRNTVSKPYGKIVAIYSKKIDDEKYVHRRYLSKSLDNKQINFGKQINSLFTADNK